MLSLSTQYSGKDRVERAHLQIAGLLLPNQSTNTLLHLASGLIGKGQRQDVPRLIGMISQQIGNLIGQHTGFSRTGTRYYQLWAVTISDGLALSLIQLF